MASAVTRQRLFELVAAVVVIDTMLSLILLMDGKQTAWEWAEYLIVGAVVAIAATTIGALRRRYSADSKSADPSKKVQAGLKVQSRRRL